MWRKIFGFGRAEQKEEPKEDPKASDEEQQKKTETAETESDEYSDVEFTFPPIRKHLNFKGKTKPKVEARLAVNEKRYVDSDSDDLPQNSYSKQKSVTFLDELRGESDSETTKPVSILRYPTKGGESKAPDLSFSRTRRDCNEEEQKVRQAYGSVGNSSVSTPSKVSFQKPQQVSFQTPESFNFEDSDDEITPPPKPIISKRAENVPKKNLSFDNYEDDDPAPSRRARRWI